MSTYSWEADHAVSQARREQSDAAWTYDAQLTALIGEYAGRRTVTAEMIRRVADLAVGYAAEADRRAQTLAETLTAKQTAVIERLEADLERSRDTGRQLRAILDEKRKLGEEREATRTGEEVQVTIGRSLKGWQVGDLEEVAYRLRCGGAVDETLVDISQYRMSAVVPAPNLVPLTRPDAVPPPPERPAPLPDPTHVDETWRLPAWSGWAAAAVAVVGSLLAAVLR